MERTRGLPFFSTVLALSTLPLRSLRFLSLLVAAPLALLAPLAAPSGLIPDTLSKKDVRNLAVWFAPCTHQIIPWHE